MTRDEKIHYTKEMFKPLDCERMAVAYSQYFKWKWNIKTIQENESDFKYHWKENWYSDKEIEQGIRYMQELARD